MSELQFYIIKDTYRPSKWIAAISLVIMLFCALFVYAAIFVVFLILFILSGANILLIRYWMKNDVDDEYHDMLEKFIEENTPEKAKIDYASLPEYAGKESFGVHRIYVYYIVPIMFAIFSYRIVRTIIYYYLGADATGSQNIGIAMLGAVALLFICLLIIMNKKVNISKDGVRLKDKANNIDKLFKWKDIQTIGIGKNGEDITSADKFIYISTQKLKYRPKVKKYYEDTTTIVLHYSNRAAHCLLKYWDGKMYNLDDLKSWGMYVEKVQKL